MKPWNLAAWRRNTYRAQKTVGPVGDYLHAAAHQSEMSEIACKGCGYHLCSCVTAPAVCACGQSTADHSLAIHADWFAWSTGLVVEKPAESTGVLTLADVAKLPVGTRVVVVDEGGCRMRAGAEFTLLDVNEHSTNFSGWSLGFEKGRRVTFRVAAGKPSLGDSGDEECSACDGLGDFGAPCGNGGAPCEECGGLGRVPSEPALLTLDEAAEACRAGKVVRDVTGALHGWRFAWQLSAARFVYATPGHPSDWQPCRFPEYDALDGARSMLFEVVE